MTDTATLMIVLVVLIGNSIALLASLFWALERRAAIRRRYAARRALLEARMARQAEMPSQKPTRKDFKLAG